MAKASESDESFSLVPGLACTNHDAMVARRFPARNRKSSSETCSRLINKKTSTEGLTQCDRWIVWQVGYQYVCRRRHAMPCHAISRDSNNNSSNVRFCFAHAPRMRPPYNDWPALAPFKNVEDNTGLRAFCVLVRLCPCVLVCVLATACMMKDQLMTQSGWTCCCCRGVVLADWVAVALKRCVSRFSSLLSLTGCRRSGSSEHLSLFPSQQRGTRARVLTRSLSACTWLLGFKSLASPTDIWRAGCKQTCIRRTEEEPNNLTSQSVLCRCSFLWWSDESLV